MARGEGRRRQRASARDRREAHALSERPTASQLLETPGALLSRSHLRELGLERRAVDAVFRTLETVHLPGYSRPFIEAEDFRALIDECKYDGKTAVRPR
jgi:hypothetical protein